jgi:hypothetical protein
LVDNKNVPGKISQAIITLCKEYFNYTTPPIIANVTAVNGTSANVGTDSGNFSDDNVPILQPTYTGTGATLNLAVGDKAIIAFIGGHGGNPVIIGKI